MISDVLRQRPWGRRLAPSSDSRGPVVNTESRAGLDEMLLLIVLGLLVFGLTMVYSASAVFAANRYHDDTFFLSQLQLLYRRLRLALSNT